MMKRRLAKIALRLRLRRFLRDPESFHRLLGQAIQLQCGLLGEDPFRERLHAFFAALDRTAWKELAGFDALKKKLDCAGGYKTGIVRFGPEPGPLGRRFTVWGRRFGMLGRLGVRSDVLILRQGEQIPPHGHHRVVSGFYVLDGRVAARNFDRVTETGDGVLVRKVLDTVLGPGGHTTNSEFHHNIHWLLGLAPVSYLFRITVTDVATATFGKAQDGHERVYVDPHGHADAAGLIAARYVSEAEARQVPYDDPDSEACLLDASGPGEAPYPEGAA